MAGSKTNYLAGALLNHALGIATYTPPGQLYLALFSADPGEAGSLGSELVGAGYVRKPIAFGTQTNQATANTQDVTFDDATNVWLDITHYGVCDAASGGNVLYHTDVEGGPISIPAGAAFRLRAGQLTIEET